MWKLTRNIFLVCFIHVCSNVLFLNSQEIDQPRGPWQLAFKVVSGNWDSATTGHSTFWELFTSTDTYNTESPVPSQRDFSTSSDHYKSETVELWEDGYISVQAIKISLFKNDEEKAYVVFDAIGKTKSTWFKCDNILYSSFTDLPDQTLPAECPGRNVYNGLPLTLMKVSYMMAYCPLTTGWLVIADTDFGFTLCPDYMPAGDSGSKPYFKYSSLPTIADLSTQLETADSMGIFFQVWDLAFKGVEGIKPSAAGLSNLTGLFLTDLTENDNSDLTVRNLQHTQSSLIFKSDIINLWDTYFIDMVKFSMLKSGVEQAFVVFDGSNTDKTSWFSESNILYSSYGSPLNDAALEVCSIEGDSYRNWQIQSVADDTGCSSAEQMGWMLVKEPRNNGTCSWDTSTLKKKPYFLYNTDSSATNPSLFQYADVVAVFVHGWRLVFKVSAGGSVSPMSGIYTLWTGSGGLNENLTEASTISSPTTFKSSIIDQWTSYYIRAVKIAAYKSGMEVVSAVFDGTGSSDTDWLDCRRLLYTSVTGLTGSVAANNAYTCSMEGESSTFRFFIGKSPDCGTVSASGVFYVVDADSACSSRNDLPQFVYSSTLDTALDDTTESQLADSFAIFVDMANCYGDTCLNGGTCQDLGGKFRCFCVGSYYGDTCANLDGTYEVWSSWSACSVTCASGTQTRTRTCTGAEGEGVCDGDSSETIVCTLDPCPIDGGFTAWSEWSTCSVSCGNGESYRTRDCTNPAPEHGGATCAGDDTETIACYAEECPDGRSRRASEPTVDGGFTEWSDWSECTVTCGGGEQTRVRSCTNPEPQNGGSDCSGDTEESQGCGLESCPVDGGFTEWGSWSVCSVTCGNGEQTRTRTCTNPVPQLGGEDCEGDTEEIQTCSSGDCPVNGGFTDWSSWGDCSVTCGEGVQIRTRNCSNPAPLNGGEDCAGDSEESQACDQGPCSVDGYLTEWEEWSTCSASCNGGTRERHRTCVEPLDGGNPCVGAIQQSEFCNTQICPLDGTWSEWTEWENCSEVCGGGARFRSRTCIGPLHGGVECTGNAQENETCNEEPCPIDGYWSDWNEWSTCTLTCNTGTRERTRVCTGQQYGGQTCPGATSQSEFCNSEPCPVDGEWLGWSEWSPCTSSCGGGSRNRSRVCVEPLYGGSDCEGEHVQTETCNNASCPVDGYWLEWSKWGSCSVSCAGGVRNRSRTCIEPLHGGFECIGEKSQYIPCDNGPCPVDGYWSEWSAWTKCSKTCGGGLRNKTRACIEPLYGGRACEGEASETDTCNIDVCPIDGEWSDWAPWSTCTATCGGGTRKKNRTCSEPKYGGKYCDGEESETDMCNVDPCSVDGFWEEWSDWSECTVSCEGGSRDRFRACVEPKFGGSACEGVDEESEECNSHMCPVDGEWTTWSDWSQCSSTCNGGARNRSRLCTIPEFGGKNCTGHKIEIQICGIEACPSVDGGWSTWTAWSACSMTCGFAERLRNRTCTNPSPQWGGRYCEGVHIQSDSCKENDCPVDGGWTEWTDWSPCFNMTVNNVSSPKCGRGFKQRNRSCDNPTPQFDGSECLGNATEVKTCNIPCHRVTCSKENPEQCQIIFEYIPENRGSKKTVSCFAGLLFVLFFIIRLLISA